MLVDNEEFWDAAFLYLPETDEEIIVYCKQGKRGILAGETEKNCPGSHTTLIQWRLEQTA